MKVNVRTEYAVMMTGVGRRAPASASAALNALQNSMMLRPRWPRAGPTGADGFGLTGLDLQLDVSGYFLCHFCAPASSSLHVLATAGLLPSLL